MITPIKSERKEMATGVLRNSDTQTRTVIGCCFQVHRALGPGFPERIYEAALVECLKPTGLSVDRQRRFQVEFAGAKVGEFQIDLLIGGRVIVEVKAVAGPLPKVFTSQLVAYLKAAGLPVGLLVNFGNPSCEVKRLGYSPDQSAKSVMKSAKSNYSLGMS